MGVVYWPVVQRSDSSFITVFHYPLDDENILIYIQMTEVLRSTGGLPIGWRRFNSLGGDDK